jgi:hypothetical protein
MIVEALKCTRKNGDRITVLVNITEIYGQRIDFAVYDVQLRPHGMRKVFSVRERITNRTLRGSERQAYIEEIFLAHVTREEMRQAVENAWKSIKPDTEHFIISG